MKYLILSLIVMIAGCTAPGDQGRMEPSVPQDPTGVNPLLIGEKVPDLPVMDKSGGEQHLLTRISDSPAVIVFYRGGWCPFCSAHLSELATYEEEIYEMGYRLLAISPDRPEYLRETLEDRELNYTLLSDSSMELARAFGIAFREDDETTAGLKENGMDIIARSGFDHQQLPVPAVFITDPSGKILFQYVNPNYKERINGEILMAALKAFSDPV